MTIRFLYFDMGRVILNFDHERMLFQIARAAGVSVEAIRDALFNSGLLGRLERGLCTSEEAHELVRERLGFDCSFETLLDAANDIFTLNTPILPVLSSLFFMNVPMGILSNTSEAHFEHCRRKFRPWVDSFSLHAVSYRLGVVKPEPEIFAKAAQLAGYEPGEIFFTDDTPGHVEGALKAGFDAEVFEGPEKLASQLRERGIPLNY